MRPLRILTWHVHGTYLWYLSHIRHELIVPVKAGRPPGYGGRAGTWRWPPNVREAPAATIADEDVDALTDLLAELKHRAEARLEAGRAP